MKVKRSSRFCSRDIETMRSQMPRRSQTPTGSDQQAVVMEFVVACPAAGLVKRLGSLVRHAGRQDKALGLGLDSPVPRSFEQPSADTSSSNTGIDEEIVEDPQAPQRDRREGRMQLHEPDRPALGP